ncbi:MAG: tetratricopeptide repeat protein [Planctomycetota bacterium]|jgi:tetratricopeptide (TPR) repeat protein
MRQITASRSCSSVARAGALAVLLVASGCDRPDGGPAPSAAPEQVATASTEPAAAAAPREPEPLGPELSEMFMLIQQYRTGPARVRLRKYRNLHPDDGKAVFLFGLTYHREKRYAKAMEYFREAVELNPEYPLTYHFMGWAHYYLGEPDASREAFEHHLQVQPDVGDSHFGIGLIALDEDRLDDAERRFRRSIELQEDDPARSRELSKSHVQLAEVLARRGRLEEARSALLLSVELFPDQYEAYYRLYRVLLRLGLEQEAEEALARHRIVKERVRPGTSFPE